MKGEKQQIVLIHLKISNKPADMPHYLFPFKLTFLIIKLSN